MGLYFEKCLLLYVSKWIRELPFQASWKLMSCHLRVQWTTVSKFYDDSEYIVYDFWAGKKAQADITYNLFIYGYDATHKLRRLHKVLEDRSE